MKFDLWTIVFQVINFGVLLLILKRVLYKPVREIMERRRTLAVRTLEEAENARKAAQELQAKNQADQQDLEGKRSRFLEDMKAEVAQQRQKLLTAADLEVQQHVAKERALFAAEKGRQTAETREQAIAAVALFASNIFAAVADADLHLALYRRLLDEMEKIRSGFSCTSGARDTLDVDVTSAYPLAEADACLLREGLEKAAACPVVLKITIDRELLAGVRIMVNDRVYDSSLRGQLATFITKVRKNV